MFHCTFTPFVTDLARELSLDLERELSLDLERELSFGLEQEPELATAESAALECPACC